MGLPRDLVRLLESIEETIDPFSPSAKDQLLVAPPVAPVLTKLQKSYGEKAGLDVALLSMQSLAVQKKELKSGLLDAELVATLPGTHIPNVRQTSAVINEMLGNAKHEIIALGYEISDEEFVRNIQDASARDIDISLVCDRTIGSGAKLKGNWPKNIREPVFFHDREREDAAVFAKMHSKTLMVDSSVMLVSSANFTFHGLNGNIEFGLRVRGRQVLEARNLVRKMINSGLLERI